MSFPLPQYIQLYPTTRCNQNCFFCFNHPSASQQKTDLSYDNAMMLLNILGDIPMRDIDIMGGEPLLLTWMPDFIRAALSRDMSVNISTNGSFPEIMSKMKGMDPARFNIGVSLEGSTEAGHNGHTRSKNFSLALRSIQNLVSLELDPIV
ncbi:MAG: radical SAM protein, partial [Nitrospirae bacterium]|nr:radical SAM protein [Nitrospirota bacterium]